MSLISDILSSNRTSNWNNTSINQPSSADQQVADGGQVARGQSAPLADQTQQANATSNAQLLQNTSQDITTLKALSQAGLQATQQSVAMVQEMMNAGMSINRENVLALNRSLMAFPGAEVALLVQMKSLDLPITQNSLEQFISYKNLEHQVVSEIDQIASQMPDTFKSLIDNGSFNDAMDMYGDLLEMFSNSEQGQTMESAFDGENGEQIPGEMEAAAEYVQGTDDTMEALTSRESVQIVSDNGDLSKTGNEQTASDRILNDMVADESIESQTTQGEKQVSNAPTPEQEFSSLMKQVGVSDEAISRYFKAQEPGNHILTAQIRNIVKDLAKEIGDAYQNIKGELQNPENAAKTEAFHKLFSSPSFSKLLKEAFSTQWMLGPSEVADKENVKDLYARLNEQTKHMSEILSQTAGDKVQITKSANSLSQNLDFMNQLNQMFNYVQLPLKMANQNANGELLVYKNKKKKISDDGSVSALLHLDMANLGPLDVFVKMKNSNVTTNFFVSDESVLDLIEAHIDSLTDHLERRGYHLSANLKMMDEDASDNAVIAEMLDVAQTPIMSAGGFDVKA